MNLEELKVRFIEYLENKNQINDKKRSELLSTQMSVFFMSTDFTQFIRENLAALGIKNTEKIPTNIYEILDLVNEGENKEAEEEFTVSDIQQSQNNSSSTEITFNKSKSKNIIRSNYDKAGNLSYQNVSVYNTTGSKKSKYITEFNADGDIKSEIQMEYGAKNDINKEIGYNEQGDMGDCWLLSALNSLSYTDTGKDILKNAITKNDDGSYTINFKGANTKIKITQEELKAAKNSGKYSSGDDDVLLFELGFESVIKKIEKGDIKITGEHPGFTIKKGGDSKPALESGNFEDAIFLLTGKDAISEFKETGSSTENFDKILSSLKDNPGKYAATLGISAGDNPLVLRDVNGNKICTLEAGINHAFSIKSVDDDGITIVNPWDSSKEYKISLTDARKYATGIQYIALDDSFVETDNLNSEALDSAETQSEEQVPDIPQNDIPSNTGGGGVTGGDSGSSGNIPVTPGGNTVEDNKNTDADSGDKPLDQMSKDELNAEKTTTQNSLNTSQKELEDAINGTDSELSKDKDNIETLYEEYKKQLTEIDKTMADELQRLIDDANTKEKEYGEAELNVSKKEVEYANAQTKVSELQSQVDSLSGIETSELSEEQKNNIDSVKKALEDAIKAEKNKKIELDEAEKDRDKKKEDFEKAKQARIEYEAEILKAHPEVEAKQKAYEDAQIEYDKAKAEKIDKAKASITSETKRISDIDAALNKLNLNDKNKELGLNLNDKLFDNNIKMDSEYVQAHNGVMPYLVYGPENPDPNKEYPVLVFLHGGGEFGKGESALRGSSLPYVLTNGKLRNGTDVDLDNFNGYVIFPQSQSTARPHSWKNQKSVSQVCDVLADFESSYKGGIKIDKNNIALAGHSDGAIGAQYFAGHFNDSQNKYRLSRVALMSGFSSNYSIADAKMPVLGFVGNSDTPSSLSYMRGTFKKIVGENNLFVVKGGHGNVPEQAYIIDSNNNGKSDLLEWLFASLIK